MILDRKKIAVMGGTRFDTDTGCEVLRELGADCVPSPAMRTPVEQNALQYADPEALQHSVESRCGDLARQGVGSLLVFCNSLSVAIDSARLALCSGLRVVTPLTVLGGLATLHERFFVVGANAKSVAGIEKLIYGASPGARVNSYSCLELVERIERGHSAQTIWDYGFGRIVDMALAERSNCLLLGCTHFSALSDFLADQLVDSGMALADTGRMAAELLVHQIDSLSGDSKE